MQRREAPHLRFQSAGFVARQPSQVIDAVGARALLDAAQHLDFLGVGRHHQLPTAQVLDPMLFQIAIEKVSPASAQARLQAAEGIVEAGMNDFRIA